VIGVVIHDLIGPEPAWWTIAIVIVAALTIGAYAIKASYAVFVTCLVISLAQLYALETGDLSTTLLYRLAENGTGAVIAATVATVFLPISTYSVIRTGLLGYMQRLSTFVADLGEHLTDPDVRIRSDVRAVDHALFQIKDAESLLLPPFSIHGNGRAARRYRRAKGTDRHPPLGHRRGTQHRPRHIDIRPPEHEQRRGAAAIHRHPHAVHRRRPATQRPSHTT